MVEARLEEERALQTGSGPVGLRVYKDGHSEISSALAVFSMIPQGDSCAVSVQLADSTVQTLLLPIFQGLPLLGELAQLQDEAALNKRLAEVGARAQVATVPAITPEAASAMAGKLQQRLELLFDTDKLIPKSLLPEAFRPALFEILTNLPALQKRYLNELKIDGFTQQAEQELLRMLYAKLSGAAKDELKIVRSSSDAPERLGENRVITPDGDDLPVGWLRNSSGDELGDLEQYVLAHPQAPVPAPVAEAAVKSAPQPGAVAAKSSVKQTATAGASGAHVIPSSTRTPTLPTGLWRNFSKASAYGKKAVVWNTAWSAIFGRKLGTGGPLRTPYVHNVSGPYAQIKIDGYVCQRSGDDLGAKVLTPSGVVGTVSPDACSLCPNTGGCMHREIVRSAVKAELRFMNRAGEYDHHLLRTRDELAHAWGIEPRTRMERILRLGEIKVSADKLDGRRFSYRVADPSQGGFALKDEVLGTVYQVTPQACSCGQADGCAHRDFIRQRVKHKDLLVRRKEEAAAISSPKAVYETLSHWHKSPPEHRLKRDERAQIAQHVRAPLLSLHSHRGTQISFNPLHPEHGDQIFVRSRGGSYVVTAPFWECSCGHAGCEHSRIAERALVARLTTLRDASRYDEDYRALYRHVRTTFNIGHQSDPLPIEASRAVRTVPLHHSLGRLLTGKPNYDSKQLKVETIGAKQYVVTDQVLKVRYVINDATCSCGTYRARADCAHISGMRNYINQQLRAARERLASAHAAQERANEAISLAQAASTKELAVTPTLAPQSQGILRSSADALGLGMFHSVFSYAGKITPKNNDEFRLRTETDPKRLLEKAKQAADKYGKSIQHWEQERSRFAATS